MTAPAPRSRPDRRSDPPERPLFSPVSQAERGRVGRRLLAALLPALAILALVVLLGPSAEEVERKFTPYGAEGPLRIMPEIAIEEGRDEVARQAAREASAPPPAPRYEVEPDRVQPDSEQLIPPPSERDAEQVDVTEAGEAESETAHASETPGDAAVDMVLPSQNADSDFIIRRLVRPLYPPGASIADQRRPLVTVQGAFYLDSDATIVAVMIQSNDGGPEFATAAREAMEQWEFAPRIRDGVPPAPRWLVVTWRFRSPLSGVAGG
jgi:hypothetical protein